MGQILARSKKGGEGAKVQTPVDAKALEDVLDDKTLKAINAAKDFDDFYHQFYLIIEELNVKGGAMQFKLPKKEDMRTTFNRYCPEETTPDKAKLKSIMEEMIKLDNISVGSGATNAIMFLFGVPIVALLTKRLIPAAQSISDDIVIPIATSSTVLLLTKTRKL